MSDRRCITPEGRISFPHLFTPQAFNEGDKAQYSAVILFEEGTDLTELRQCVQAAAEKKFSPEERKKLKKSGKFVSPFREDGEEKGYPEGTIYISAKCDPDPPGVVSRRQDPETGKATRITDPAEVYSGSRVKASVTAYGYDVKGNKGVTFWLNNVQLRGDGPRLDGRIAAEDEFDSEAPIDADLSDLDGPETEIDPPTEDDGDLSGLM